MARGYSKAVKILAIIHLVMTNSSPWKDPPFLRTVNPGKPSISMGHLYHNYFP